MFTLQEVPKLLLCRIQASAAIQLLSPPLPSFELHLTSIHYYILFTMNCWFNPRQIRIPQEVVDLICYHLDCFDDINNARLVCQTLQKAASPLIPPSWQSPAELFCLPVEGECYQKTRTDDERTAGGREPKLPAIPFSIWTWSHVPRKVPLENLRTPAGRKFW